MAEGWDAFPTTAPTTVPTPTGDDGRPVTRLTVTPQAAPADSWDAFPTTRAEDPYGVAKQAGVGVAKGAIGLLTFPGDIQEVARHAGDRLAEKFGPEPGSTPIGEKIDDWWRGLFGNAPRTPEEKKKDRDYAETLANRGDLGGAWPTLGQVQGSVESVTGPFRKPQTPVERDAETVGEFLPAALTGPGSLARRVFLQDAVPATASIVAGRYSDQNPYVKALAGFLGGIAGVRASGPSSVHEIIQSKLPPSVTQQDITRAGQLIEHAQTRGVALTWPEALTRVTGQPILTDTQRVLESHGQTRAHMNEFFADRPGQVQNAARTEFNRTGQTTVLPSQIGPDAAAAAETVLGNIRGAINQATRPSYDAARQTLVPTQVHAAMMADPLFEQALNTVRNDPARNSFIRGLSDRSTVVYDAVKQELSERARNAASHANPNSSQTVASATGTLSGDVRNIAVAADRNAMGLAPGQGTGNLEHALAEQQRLRQTYLEPLQRGPLGKIADANPTTQRAIEALFPTNPLPNSQGEITVAIRALVGQRPAVAEQLVRAHAEMVFNEAARTLQGGANHFAGARFAKEIAGNPQQRENLRAAIEALPNGAARWRGFEQLLDIMSATGARQPKGSLTAFNALEVPSMTTGGLQEVAALGVSPGKWMSLGHDKLKAWSLGQNLDSLARLITDPRASGAFQQILRVPAGSDRALVMVGRMINQLGASTTEQRSKSGQQ